MASTASSPPTFGEILYSVKNNVIRGRISFDLWWAQEGHPSKEKYLDSMNNYPDFFRFDALAHMTAMVVGLYRLYDRRPDVRSLRVLLLAAPSASGVSPEATAKAQAVFDAADVLFPNLKTLRNKAFGHTDLLLSWNAVFDAAGVKPNDLRGMFDSAREIVNVFESELGLTTSEYYDNPEAQLQSLLGFLPH